MFKAMHIVKKEDIPIARWQSSDSALNRQTVNHPDLSRIPHAEIAPEMIIRVVGYQGVE